MHISTRQLLVSVVLALLATSARTADKLKVGDYPPDVFEKAAASGEIVRLADYRGKVVVISFWASWCSPCMKELPVLVGMQKQTTRDNLVVLSVNWRESYGKFLSIKRALGNADLTLISDRNGGIGLAYDVTAIPHMIVIGKDGKIASIHVGYSDASLPGIVEELNEILR